MSVDPVRRIDETIALPVTVSNCRDLNVDFINGDIQGEVTLENSGQYERYVGLGLYLNGQLVDEKYTGGQYGRIWIPGGESTDWVFAFDELDQLTKGDRVGIGVGAATADGNVGLPSSPDTDCGTVGQVEFDPSLVSVESCDIQITDVSESDSVSITATVGNYNPDSATATVMVLADGSGVATADRIISANDSESVTLSFVPQDQNLGADTYSIAVEVQEATPV